jgi:hypothetical protein
MREAVVDVAGGSEQETDLIFVEGRSWIQSGEFSIVGKGGVGVARGEMRAGGGF